MSHLSLGALSNAVEAFLRRDYVMADSVVDKVEDTRSLENGLISFINKEDNIIRNKSVDINIKLILETYEEQPNMQVI